MTQFGTQNGWRGQGMSTGLGGPVEDFAVALNTGSPLTNYDLWDVAKGGFATVEKIQAAGDSDNFSGLAVYSNNDEAPLNVLVTRQIFDLITGGRFPGKPFWQNPWVLGGVAVALMFFVMKRK